MNHEKMLVLNNLNVWYTPGKPVLEKLSMELGTNEVIGLIGLNGTGKTLLHELLLFYLFCQYGGKQCLSD